MSDARSVPDPDPARRAFLRSTLAMGAGAALGTTVGSGESVAGEPSLILRNARPLDAESPVEIFDRFLTPNRLFFVRSHFGPPAVGLSTPWTLAIEGGVNKQSTFTLAQLNEFEQVTIPAVLQCAGNGRGFFAPTIPGIGWEKGAVGNAEWTGVRLADLLRRSGIAPGVHHVHFHGADGPPAPKTPAYLRSIPIDRAIDPSTIICTKMNGEPLPILHGGPIRLVVPGWAGNHWIKWLRSIHVSAVEAPGFYMQTGYKMPIAPVAPGVDVKPTDLRSVTTMNVKSLIARPSAGVVSAGGRVEVQGVAWTGGDATVTKVEVGVEQPGRPLTWHVATLEGMPSPYTWRLWRFAIEKIAGPVVIKSRASDSTGAIQPETSPWNKSGYLWNGYDQVSCVVR